MQAGPPVGQRGGQGIGLNIGPDFGHGCFCVDAVTGWKLQPDVGLGIVRRDHVPQIVGPVALLVLQIAFGNTLEPPGNDKAFGTTVGEFLVDLADHIRHRTRLADQPGLYQMRLKIRHIGEHVRALERLVPFPFQPEKNLKFSQGKVGIFGCAGSHFVNMTCHTVHKSLKIAGTGGNDRQYTGNLPDKARGQGKFILNGQGKFRQPPGQILNFELIRAGPPGAFKYQVGHIGTAEMFVQSDICLAYGMAQVKTFGIIIVDPYLADAPNRHQDHGNQNYNNRFCPPVGKTA